MRAALIDRDQKPQWSPNTLEALSNAEVEQTYIREASPEQLELPADSNYKAYPYARLALPTEQDVRQLVGGTHADSASLRTSSDDVIVSLMRRWENRAFVRERVQEIVQRCCKEDATKGLIWTGLAS